MAAAWGAPGTSRMRSGDKAVGSDANAYPLASPATMAMIQVCARVFIVSHLTCEFERCLQRWLYLQSGHYENVPNSCNYDTVKEICTVPPRNFVCNISENLDHFARVFGRPPLPDF